MQDDEFKAYCRTVMYAVQRMQTKAVDGIGRENPQRNCKWQGKVSKSDTGEPNQDSRSLRQRCHQDGHWRYWGRRRCHLGTRYSKENLAGIRIVKWVDVILEQSMSEEVIVDVSERLGVLSGLICLVKSLLALPAGLEI
jgi:hypothetical protein